MRTTVALIILSLLVWGCSTQKEITETEVTSILDGLGKNYTVYKNLRGAFNEFRPPNNQVYIKDSLEYRNAVTRFYSQDKGMINSLLKYKKDTLHHNQWLITRHPYSSYLGPYDFPSNSSAALVLIDNYLNNNSDTIIVPDYASKLTYKEFLNFYNKNKHLKKRSLQRKYQEYITAKIK